MSYPALGYLLPAAPFVAAIVGLLLSLRGPSASGRNGRAARRVAAGLGIGGAAVVLAAAVALLFTDMAIPDETRTWIEFGSVQVTFGLRLNAAAVLVAVAVGAVALAVQVYSTAYLADDDRYPVYAAQVSLFTAAMLLVVVAGDLIMLLVGWEVMGACSYLLIAHDRRLPEAPAAAVKAFLVTRVGDVGFLLGIAVLGITAGSFNIAEVLAYDYSATTATTAALLLLAGVAGKSAQFPLHTWLPDAMAGPTPISALIHAATMVAAGVYVVARLHQVFLSAPVATTVLGVLAVITLLLGALAATAADDIKRVLAWSTVSQLGYMTGALAVNAPGAALFHLLTHAAFKALLFLAAGCVIHAVGSNLMSQMGGLRQRMPVTFWSMAIGLGALAGLPPLAGFWSKEGVLVAAEHGPVADGAPGWLGPLVWVAGLVGVALTGWYATRLLLRTFFGPPRVPADQHPHDPPAAMRWPVLALTVPSALLGFAVFSPVFRDWLRGVAEPAGGLGSGLGSGLGLGLGEELAPHFGPALLLPMALLAAGVGWAVWLHRQEPAADPARVLGRLRSVFAAGFGFDAVQRALVVRPVVALAGLARAGDESGVDGVVRGVGRGVGGLGGLLGRWHAAQKVPRAVTLALAGALLLGLAAVVTGGLP